MNNIKPIFVAAYIRVSTEDQLEFSPDSQLHKIQEYVKAHQLILPESYIFIDEGISGRSAKKRPAFMKMIQMAKQKPQAFSQILVWKFSRFSRNRQDSIFYKSMLWKECNIRVISITEPLNNDPTSILIEALLEAMDEYYSINLAQEVQRGMNEKFLRGGVVSPPPFGYLMGKNTYMIDEKNGPLLQMIFEDFLMGSSYREIAEKLNHMNIKTARKNDFQARSIKYILQNPVYIGKQRRKSTSPALVSAAHTPLISEEIFEKVQDKIQQLEKQYSKYSYSYENKSPFMLSGLVRCSCCNSTLTSSKKGKNLQCHKYTKGLCPESHSISLSILNTRILEQLEKDFPTKKITSYLNDTQVSEREKNQFLRSFISKIIFNRKENTFQVYYY